MLTVRFDAQAAEDSIPLLPENRRRCRYPFHGCHSDGCLIPASDPLVGAFAPCA